MRRQCPTTTFRFDYAMKSLYALSGSTIAVLLLAAFNPGTVVDAFEVAKIRLVEMPQAIHQLEERERGAETGRMVDLYHIGMYHISSSEYRWPSYYADVLGDKNRERGMNMLHRAATVGHPEALFMISQFDVAGDDYLEAAIELGSNQALGKLYLDLLEDPCDESAREYLDLARRRMSDPDYPWVHPEAQSTQREMRDSGKEQLRRDLNVIHSVSAESCATV